MVSPACICAFTNCFSAKQIIIVNKIDTIEKEKLLEVIAVYSQAAEFVAIVPISAKTGDGVEELLKVCEKYGWHRIPCVEEGKIRSIEEINRDILKIVLKEISE